MTRPVPLPKVFLNVPLAHRGYHDLAARRPENSLAAFRAAIEAGYGIELDVQRTADAQAVVFHDDTLDRLAETTGPVLGHTAAELATVSLCGSDQTIPTLSEALALVAGRVPVLIEIKEGLDTMLPTPGLLEAAVARALDGYDGPVAVMSFNPHSVAHMARLAPDIARGLTTESYDPQANAPIPPETCARLREIPDYDRTFSSFISHQVSDLARPRVANLKSQGAAILCWTVRSPQAEAEARRIADNITFEGYAASITGA
jgi:glycerophosphoryl diester phosphodiesterase